MYVVGIWQYTIVFCCCFVLGKLNNAFIKWNYLWCGKCSTSDTGPYAKHWFTVFESVMYYQHTLCTYCTTNVQNYSIWTAWLMIIHLYEKYHRNIFMLQQKFFNFKSSSPPPRCIISCMDSVLKLNKELCGMLLFYVLKSILFFC